MAPKETEVRRFRAEAAGGKIYVVIEYEVVIQSREVRPDAQSDRGRSVKQFKLEGGFAVNQIDANTFEIAGTKEIIRKI